MLNKGQTMLKETYNQHIYGRNYKAILAHHKKAKKEADCLVKAGDDVAKQAACATDEEDSVTEEATKAAKAVRK